MDGVEEVRGGSSDTALERFRCVSCDYGAASRMAPLRCPMCGGGVWAYEGAARARVELERYFGRRDDAEPGE